MLTLIICAGIYLPNGQFLPNAGDGHAKNARRFINLYPELMQLSYTTYEKEDDFLLQCGCAIIAGYDGHRCFKVADDNPYPVIKALREMYESSDEFEIWNYWKINDNYLPVINSILDKIATAEVTEKFEDNKTAEVIDCQKTVDDSNTHKNLNHVTKEVTTMNLNNKRGFILQGKWYPNVACGHEVNARKIVEANNWKQEWYNSGEDYQDFLVLRKGAVQLGSGLDTKKIVASTKFYNYSKLDRICKMYSIESENYDYVLMEG